MQHKNKCNAYVYCKAQVSSYSADFASWKSEIPLSFWQSWPYVAFSCDAQVFSICRATLLSEWPTSFCKLAISVLLSNRDTARDRHLDPTTPESERRNFSSGFRAFFFSFRSFSCSWICESAYREIENEANSSNYIMLKETHNVFPWYLRPVYSNLCHTVLQPGYTNKEGLKKSSSTSSPNLFFFDRRPKESLP